MLEAVVLASGLVAAPPPDPAVLERLLRHDCGACHGMTLKGGLGPALTAEALAGWTFGEVAAVVLSGRPGTAMPPWRGLLTEAEAAWLARRLLEGDEL